MVAHNINSLAWHQSLGVARHSCARIFRDGGTAQDAARAFGVTAEVAASDWKRAVEAIAEVISRGPVRRAA